MLRRKLSQIQEVGGDRGAVSSGGWGGEVSVKTGAWHRSLGPHSLPLQLRSGPLESKTTRPELSTY